MVSAPVGMTTLINAPTATSAANKPQSATSFECSRLRETAFFSHLFSSIMHDAFFHKRFLSWHAATVPADFRCPCMFPFAQNESSSITPPGIYGSSAQAQDSPSVLQSDKECCIHRPLDEILKHTHRQKHHHCFSRHHAKPECVQKNMLQISATTRSAQSARRKVSGFRYRIVPYSTPPSIAFSVNPGKCPRRFSRHI